MIDICTILTSENQAGNFWFCPDTSAEAHPVGRIRRSQSGCDAAASPCVFLMFSTVQILDEIAEHGIKIYQLPDADSDEDEEFKEQTRVLKVRVGQTADGSCNDPASDTFLSWYSDVYHSLPIHLCFPSLHPLLFDTFIFRISFHIPFSDFVSLWGPLSFFPRQAFPLLWLAPTSWLRWKGRRSVVVFTPGELLKWRIPSTMTSLNFAPCLCEYPW